METELQEHAGKTITPQKEIIDGRPCEVLTLPLSGHTVYFATYLGQGESDEAQAVLLEGGIISKDSKVSLVNTIASTNKQIECGIKKITQGGEEVKYSTEWYINLPKSDVDVIKEYMDEAYDQKKKHNGGNEDPDIGGSDVAGQDQEA